MRNIILIVCTNSESHKNIYSRSRWFIKFSFSVTFTAKYQSNRNIFWWNFHFTDKNPPAKCESSRIAEFLGGVSTISLACVARVDWNQLISWHANFLFDRKWETWHFHFRGIFHFIKYQILIFTETLFAVNFWTFDFWRVFSSNFYCVLFLNSWAAWSVVEEKPMKINM